MSTGKLLTAQEVAALYQVKVSTIWRRCEQGRMVPPPVMTRPFRFSPAQVQQVLDGTWTQPVIHARAPGKPRQFFARGKRAKLALVNQ